MVAVVTVHLAVTAPLPAAPLPRFTPRPPSPSTTTAACWCGGRSRLAVPKGASTQRLTLGALDPATLFSLDSTVTVVGCPMTVRWTRPARSAGRWASGSCSGCLRDPPDTRHHQRARARRRSAPAPAAGRPDQLHPAGRPAVSARRGRGGADGHLSVRSAQAQDQIRLGYFTGGASWQASYQVVLGQGGRAGDRHGGARVRVACGPRTRRSSCLPATVSRAQPQGPPRPLMREERMAGRWRMP